MGDYFRPLRRKVGVVTLVMACVFMAGWVRGFFVEDYVSLGTNHGHWMPAMSSYRGGLIFREDSCDKAFSSPAAWTSSPLSRIGSSDPMRGTPKGSYHVSWRWQWCGFDFGEALIVGILRRKWYRLPFWSIVIPLTLLSAYLLLSKPQSLKKSETSPSPEPDHA